MAGWHVIENYLEETGAHSALLGKYWITMFLVFGLTDEKRIITYNLVGFI